MIKLENVRVTGWEAALRGMRNPMNSWGKADSRFDADGNLLEIGEADLDLALRLAKGGSEDGKFKRMIKVTVDITAPLYWWKDFDTYKVGTTSNGCSTMHKIHEKEFAREDFSTEHLTEDSLKTLDVLIDVLNANRTMFNALGEKENWWQMIQLLPTSYNQRRTIDLNYEVLSAVYRQRRLHKLDEFRIFCKWIETLPYSELIIRHKTAAYGVYSDSSDSPCYVVIAESPAEAEEKARERFGNKFAAVKPLSMKELAEYANAAL